MKRSLIGSIFGLACVLIVGGCSDQQQPVELAQQTPQPVSEEMKILNWGPKSTMAGQGFNVQSNGDSALGFEATPIGGANTYEILFGDNKLTTIAIEQNKGGSVQIPPALLEKPGKFKLTIITQPSGKSLEIGTFEVLEKQ